MSRQQATISRLRPLIRAGFYPTLLFNRLLTALGVWNRWDWVDEHVVLGALPTRRDLERLAGLGVGGVINMCEEFSGHAAALAACGLSQLHLPTLDYHPPSAEDVERGLAFIAEHIERGSKVYIHCKAGRGRSATLVLCYLVERNGCTAGEAYELLRAARGQVDRNILHREVVRHIDRRIRCAADDHRDPTKT